jgi:hypothetical protein
MQFEIDNTILAAIIAGVFAVIAAIIQGLNNPKRSIQVGGIVLLITGLLTFLALSLLSPPPEDDDGNGQIVQTTEVSLVPSETPTSTPEATPTATMPTNDPSVAAGQLQCGNEIQGQFTQNNEVQEFPIFANAESILSIRGNSLSSYLNLAVGLQSPTGDWLNTSGGVFVGGLGGHEQRPSVTTDPLPIDGEYTIVVRSAGENGVGRFTLGIGCTSADGEITNIGDVASNDSFPTPTDPLPLPTDVVCGNLIEGMFIDNSEAQSFNIGLEFGQVVTLRAVSSSPYLNLAIGLQSPTGDWLETSGGVFVGGLGGHEQQPSITTRPLPITHTYTIVARSASANGAGRFTLGIGCTSADGEITNIGDVASNSDRTEPVDPLPQSTDVACGDVVQKQFSQNLEVQEFSIGLEFGSTVTIQGRALNSQLVFAIGLQSPTNDWLETSGGVFVGGLGGHEQQPSITTRRLPITHTYTIVARSGQQNSIGNYEMEITCASN